MHPGANDMGPGSERLLSLLLGGALELGPGGGGRVCPHQPLLHLLRTPGVGAGDSSQTWLLSILGESRFSSWGSVFSLAQVM